MSSPKTEQEKPRQSHGETKSANAPYKCHYCWLLLYLVDWPVSLENQREVIFWENISVGSLTFDQGILWRFDPAHLCRWRDATQTLGSAIPPPFYWTCHLSSCQQCLGTSMSLLLGQWTENVMFSLSINANGSTEKGDHNLQDIKNHKVVWVGRELQSFI